MQFMVLFCTSGLLQQSCWTNKFTLVIVSNMVCLSSGGGKPTYNVLSKRPGRRTAGSMISEPEQSYQTMLEKTKMGVKWFAFFFFLPGRLVAAMMKTWRRVSNPSISVSNWFTTRTLAPDWTHKQNTYNHILLFTFSINWRCIQSTSTLLHRWFQKWRIHCKG